ncbi:MAG: hypothetical protein AAGF15_12340 [Pseudomonadota bacterium]
MATEWNKISFRLAFSAGLAILLTALTALVVEADEKADRRGKYLGETEPGMTPKVFAPGFVSTEDGFELNATFAPEGGRFLFSRRIDNVYKIMEVQKRDGVWGDPLISPISRTYPGHADVDMMFTGDSKRLFFISNRPLAGYALSRYNIWHSDWSDEGWMVPEPLGPHINGPKHELYPMIVGDGSLYFTTERGDSRGGRDIYRAPAISGEEGKPAFGTPTNVGSGVNSTFNEGDVFVAPDESYMIFVSNGRPDGLGGNDLYISFRTAEGNWGTAVNMGDTINTPGLDFCPMVTPDGENFFFSRAGDIYWVDAKIIDTFRP